MAKHIREEEDLREPSGQDSGKHTDKKAEEGNSEAAGKKGLPPNLVSNILIGAGVILLIVAAIIFGRNQLNYKQIDDINNSVAEYAKLTDDGEQPPKIDWAGLKAMNPDIVGWIQVPHTVINYPVYQSGDNDYYLHHAPDGSSSIGGSVFLDYENTAPGMVDAQTIVYGHHMRNGSQFKHIADMDKQEMFDGVNLIWYCTENSNYDLAPLFLYYTNEGDTEVRQFTFANNKEFHDYLNMYYGKVVTKRPDAEAIIAQVDHVFTLSTCNYYDGEGRTLLVCVPRNEIPGTPQYEAAAPARAQKKAEEEAAAKAAAAQAAAQAQSQPAANEGAQLDENGQPVAQPEEAPAED